MNTTLEDYARLVISIIFVGVYAYLVASGREIDPDFGRNLLIVLGFYFGINEIGKVIAKVYTSRRVNGGNHVTDD